MADDVKNRFRGEFQLNTDVAWEYRTDTGWSAGFTVEIPADSSAPVIVEDDEPFDLALLGFGPGPIDTDEEIEIDPRTTASWWHEKAASGEVSLLDVPVNLRWNVRTHRARWWSRDSRGTQRVGWPIGYLDPFAGRPGDTWLEPDAIVETTPNDSTWSHVTEDEWDNGFRIQKWDLIGRNPHEQAAPDWVQDQAPDREEPTPGVGSAAPSTLVAIQLDPLTARHRLLRIIQPEGQGIGRGKIASAPDGTLYQSAYLEIRHYALDGTLLHRWGSQGRGAGQLHGALGLSVHPDGSVFVADRGNDRVQRFAADGGFLGGFGNGRIKRPTVYSWSSEEARLRERPNPDLLGDYGWLFCGPTDVMDLAVTPDGRGIYVADLGDRNVGLVWLDPDAPERFGPSWSDAAYAVSVSPDGETVYVVGNKGYNLNVYGPNRGDGRWVPPADHGFGRYEDVDAAPDGTVYLLDETRGRIHWLTPDGALIETIQIDDDDPESETPENDRPGFFALLRRYTRPDLDRPSGVASLAHDGRIVVAVTMHSGEIILLERDWWTSDAAAA